MDISKHKEELLEFFSGIKVDLSHDDMPNLALIYRILKNHPTIALINTRVENGVVMLYNPSKSIEYITGYKPHELDGKPLSVIMANKPNAKEVKALSNEINKHGALTKHNVNLCKDGTTVKTDGLIIKEKHNQYLEIVWKRSNTIDLE